MSRVRDLSDVRVESCSLLTLADFPRPVDSGRVDTLTVVPGASQGAMDRQVRRGLIYFSNRIV
jgi:hypothetical protein